MTEYYSNEILKQQKRQADALEGILDFLTNSGVHNENGRCTLSEALRDTVFRVNER